MSDEEAPGWDAIDAALAPIVAATVPRHWGTGTGIPDQDGIWGISAYALDGHWLYVTYGLTELFTKVSDVESMSGWGSEMTMRLARLDEAEAPQWPVRLLARLGEIVFQRSTMFTANSRLEIPDAAGSIPPAVCWVEDPVLPPTDGPFGRFNFLATVGISLEQLAAMRASSTTEVMAALRPANPLLTIGGPGLEV